MSLRKIVADIKCRPDREDDVFDSLHEWYHNNERDIETFVTSVEDPSEAQERPNLDLVDEDDTTPSFLVGDVVRLQSGGPAMTVADVNDRNIFCRYFSQDADGRDELESAEFAEAELLHEDN